MYIFYIYMVYIIWQSFIVSLVPSPLIWKSLYLLIYILTFFHSLNLHSFLVTHTVPDTHWLGGSSRESCSEQPLDLGRARNPQASLIRQPPPAAGWVTRVPAVMLGILGLKSESISHMQMYTDAFTCLYSPPSSGSQAWSRHSMKDFIALCWTNEFGEVDVAVLQVTEGRSAPVSPTESWSWWVAEWTCCISPPGCALGHSAWIERAEGSVLSWSNTLSMAATVSCNSFLVWNSGRCSQSFGDFLHVISSLLSKWTWEEHQVPWPHGPCMCTCACALGCVCFCAHTREAESTGLVCSQTCQPHNFIIREDANVPWLENVTLRD